MCACVFPARPAHLVPQELEGEGIEGRGSQQSNVGSFLRWERSAVAAHSGICGTAPCSTQACWPWAGAMARILRGERQPGVQGAVLSVWYSLWMHCELWINCEWWIVNAVNWELWIVNELCEWLWIAALWMGRDTKEQLCAKRAMMQDAARRVIAAKRAAAAAAAAVQTIAPAGSQGFQS